MEEANPTWIEQVQAHFGSFNYHEFDQNTLRMTSRSSDIIITRDPGNDMYTINGYRVYGMGGQKRTHRWNNQNAPSLEAVYILI